MTAVDLSDRFPTDTDPAAKRSGKYLPGEVGLWVMVIGDMTFFSLFFGMILVCRGQQKEMFDAAQNLLHPDLAVVNTLVLLTGSYFVARALHSLRNGGRPRGLVVATMGCAITFATIKVTEYVDLVQGGHTLTTNDFFMYYFVFTGIHLLHLLIGFGMLVALLVIAFTPKTRQLTRGRLKLAEISAVIWHMIDLLWLVLFPLFYVVH